MVILMKRCVALLSALALLFSAIFGTVVLGENSTEAVSSAYDVVKSAILSGDKNSLDSTDWQLFGGANVQSGYARRVVNSVGGFTSYDSFSSEKFIPDSSLKAFVLNDYRTYAFYGSSVAAYTAGELKAENFTGIDGASLPEKGIIISARSGAPVCSGISWHADSDAEVTLKDPNGGSITAVKLTGGKSERKENHTLTAGADDGMSIEVYVYKNTEELISFELSKADGYSKAFPALSGISVSKGDYIHIVFKTVCIGKANAVVALNPCVVKASGGSTSEPIAGDKHNAAEELLGCLEKDIPGGKPQSIFTDTGWGFEEGSVSFSKGFSEMSIEKAAPFFTYSFATSPWTATPHAEIPGYSFNWSNNAGVFTQQQSPLIKPSTSGTGSKQGIILSTISGGYTAITYTFAESGTAALTDPDGGYISAVSTVDGVNAYTVDTGDKKINIAIYKNSEKLWPQNEEYYELNIDRTAVKLPRIDNITVRENDKLRIVFKQEKPGMAICCVTLNPQVNLVPGYVEPEPAPERDVEDKEIIDMIDATVTTNAADVLGAAIKADSENKTLNYLGADSRWSIQSSSAGFASGWSELSPDSVGNTFYLNLAEAGWPVLTADNFPLAYKFGPYSNWGFYDISDSITAKPVPRGILPQRGIIGYFMIQNTYAVCWTAEKAGTVSLYDPNGADITAASRIGNLNANSLDADWKKLHVAIYKNNEKLWPTDADYFEFNNRVASVEFPDIQGIQVNEGDVIRIAMSQASSSKSNMLVALNPQIDFIAYSKNVHPAADEVATAIEVDIENGNDGYAGDTQISKLYGEYAWRVEKYEDSKWELIKPTGIKKLDIGAAEDKPAPDMLNFESVSIGKYLSSHYNMKSAVTLPDSGLLLKVSDLSKPISFTYTATDDKFIRLRDPLLGFIAAVTEMSGVETEGNLSETGLKISILKNNDILWQAEGGELSTGKVKFPDISVAAEEGDSIRIVIEAQHPENLGKLLLTLNPVITGYSIAVAKVITTEIGAITQHNAYAEISEMMSSENDKAEKLYSSSNWRVQSSKSLSDGYKTEYPGYISPEHGVNDTVYLQRFTVYNAAAAPTDKYPTAYAFDWNKFMAPFNQSNNLKAFNISRLPKNGIVMTVMDRNIYHALTYTATSDGELHIYDPDNGYITAIDQIDSIALRSCDYDSNFSKNVEIAIYKNSEKLWPVNSDSAVFQSRGANEEKSIFFPDLVGIEVKKGDEIRFVIHCVGDSDTIPAVIALNPQIDYTAIDYTDGRESFIEVSYSETVTDVNREVIETVIPGVSGYDIITERTQGTGKGMDETEDTQIIRRKKKIVRVTNEGGTSAYVWFIIGGSALVAAGGLTAVVVYRRKRAERQAKR